MKISVLGTLLLVVTLVNGCARFEHQPKAAKATPAAAPALVTPDNSLTARVVSYNSAGRFVVLGFSVGQMPGLEQGLFLYRNGIKVGEVRVTGPQRDNNIVADIVTGEARVGDEVRDK
jgi:hypothetical protein